MSQKQFQGFWHIVIPSDATLRQTPNSNGWSYVTRGTYKNVFILAKNWKQLQCLLTLY